MLFGVALSAQITQLEVDSASRSAKSELGRLLFRDSVLSGPRDIACATCHHPDFAYADGRELSLGTGSIGLGPHRRNASGGRIPVVRRNAPTLLNAVFNGADDGRRGRVFDPTPGSFDQARAPMFWDRRVRSLEAQALEPLNALEEMRGMAYTEDRALDSVVSRLRSLPEYVGLFRAAFERTLVAMNSPFDRFRAGDRRRSIPLSYAVASECRPDAAIHAQRHACNA